MSLNGWLGLIGGLLTGAAAFWYFWSIQLDQSNLLLPILFGVVMFFLGCVIFYGMFSYMDREQEIDEMLEHYKRERK
jgi:RsiW-degrading membrane proteinase PrsW (M82 family)